MGKKKKRGRRANNKWQSYQPNQERLDELASRIKPFAKVRIYAGYLFLLALLILAKPHPLYFIIGTVFIMAGTFQRIMSAGTLVKAASADGDTLIMTGPYGKSRHPLYFGSFLDGIGFVCLAGPLGNLIPSTREILTLSVPLGLFPWGLIPFLIMLVPIYFKMILIEEDFLAEKFGPLYDKYRGIVPCFFPRLSFLSRDPDWKFDAERLKANREMRNFIWLMVVYVLFFLKMLYYLANDLFRISLS